MQHSAKARWRESVDPKTVQRQVWFSLVYYAFTSYGDVM